MGKAKLNVLGTTTSQSHSGAYALILEDETSKAKIPIVIGEQEAQSITIALKGITPKRPLTHDLLVNIANSQDMILEEINIHKVENGIFYSNLIFNSKFGTVIMDARTSDAIALALRLKAPIFTTKAIIDKTSINPKNNTITTNHLQSAEVQIANLEERLKKVISIEQYKEAAQIKQQIDTLRKEL